KPVVIPSQVQIGSTVPVKIVDTTANYLIGKLI
ncbi:MAG TPA: TRAM domain-containing protein, partial [Thermoplasmatales archaeon]|nr:TRAM domain-containing protein [Thermoplasmatales archaeon]